MKIGMGWVACTGCTLMLIGALIAMVGSRMMQDAGAGCFGLGIFVLGAMLMLAYFLHDN
jgi:hypothetical protein